MPSKAKSRTMTGASDLPDLYSMRFPSVPYVRTYPTDACSMNEFICSISATNYNDQCPYKKSVEDVSEETRYILEEFIIERASEDGVDMGLVKPIINIDLVACRIEQDAKLSSSSFNSSTAISSDSADCPAITDDR
jgi:hypothetical protein